MNSILSIEFILMWYMYGMTLHDRLWVEERLTAIAR